MNRSTFAVMAFLLATTSVSPAYAQTTDDSQSTTDAAAAAGANGSGKTPNKTDDQGKDNDKPEEKDELPAEPGFDTKHVFFLGGATLLNPFKITAPGSDAMDASTGSRTTTDTGTDVACKQSSAPFCLNDSSDDEVRFFLEFAMRSRRAWDLARAGKDKNNAANAAPTSQPLPLGPSAAWSRAVNNPPEANDEDKPLDAEAWETHAEKKGRSGGKRFADGLARLLVPRDFDLKTGFTFGNNDADGAAILGSGDMHLAGSIGWPWFYYKDANFVHTLGPEIVGGAITDRGAQDIHGFFGYGGIWTIGYLGEALSLDRTDDSKRNKRVYEILVRAGRTRLDQPKRLVPNTDSEGKTVLGYPIDDAARDGDPDFEGEWTWGAEVGLNLPFGKTGYLTMGGQFYQGDPNPWSARLGMTIPLNRVVAIIPGLGSQ